MLTIISHFFNEEFLLPFWIRHHRGLADHAILIDYASNDRSRQIIESLAPEWDVVDSANDEFAAELIDQEVMRYEREVDGWKVALNTTEFLPLDLMERLGKASGKALRLGSKTMVSEDLRDCEALSQSLVEEFPTGIDAEGWVRRVVPTLRKKSRGFGRRSFDPSVVSRYDPRTRGRIIHSDRDGKYWVGRHGSHLQTEDFDACISWFALSPWTEAFVRRKLQISSRIPRSEVEKGFGSQHFSSFEDLDETRRFLLKFTE